ncbi:hypothetical protein MGYG_06986 [Nannizzia gypsea CBS 118893]|uniref:Uncharacterized protein n=1 Tax=Arthroderma gypseum (strain ATCC MYA-4604 / CBS 118893) TaxID=535722 RepID=E4V1R8_ARTGP|nr:hypothetical protein MGYG_06986 [Nannizzia gypsea CBS 118893]EFR03983.1 hypothetical protein MGYG_06986 [Nannizzia gypsea CBS 118893]
MTSFSFGQWIEQVWGGTRPPGAYNVLGYFLFDVGRALMQVMVIGRWWIEVASDVLIGILDKPTLSRDNR